MRRFSEIAVVLPFQNKDTESSYMKATSIRKRYTIRFQEVELQIQKSSQKKELKKPTDKIHFVTPLVLIVKHFGTRPGRALSGPVHCSHILFKTA